MWESLFGGVGSSLSQNRLNLNQQAFQQAFHQALLQSQMDQHNQFLRSQLISGVPSSPLPTFRPTQKLSDKKKAEIDALPYQETTGEMVGWRAWRFHNGCLVSPYTGVLWRPGETLEANTPFESGAGVFAHKKREQVFEQESKWPVVGTVLLWGDVVEHENGYRAEFAKVGQLLHFHSSMTDSFKAWLNAEFSSE